jgi:hypothetical protein
LLTLFISYHQDDTPVLVQLLDWLEPFRHKYFIHIYYNRYDSSDAENQIEYTDHVLNANLYIYLMSQKWLGDRNIQLKEVDAVLERMHSVGTDLIHLLPVQVKPCQWRNFSKLVELEKSALPTPKQELLTYKSDVEIQQGYNLILEKLNTIVEPLRERMIEDAKIKGLPLGGFYTLLPTPKEKAPRKGAVRFSLDDAKNWLLVFVLLYLIWGVYQIGCNHEPFR